MHTEYVETLKSTQGSGLEMKGLIGQLSIPTAFAAILVMSGAGLSQTAPVAIASGAQPITLSGMSGGAKKDASCAGFIAATPNHVVQVSEDSNLSFQLKGAAGSTLLITGDKGQNFCVQALSDGKVEIPGRWNRGRYSVFVGDRNQASNRYTLMIEPMQ
jgi:hypothetical protein